MKQIYKINAFYPYFRMFFRITQLFFLVVSAWLVLACSSSKKDNLVYVGTYTGKGSDGIYSCRFNSTNGSLAMIGLAAKTVNPSFVAFGKDEKFLYAVNEIDTFQQKPSGAISVFAVDKKSGNLEFLQQVPSLGAAPCHISVDHSGKYLLVANYNGGNFAVFPIETDGRLRTASSFIQNSGKGANPDRQQGPHAHFIQSTPDNHFIMVADLGIDKIVLYRFYDKSGTVSPADSGFIKLDPGSGPRHLSFSKDGKSVYVLNELTSTVTVFAFEQGTGFTQKKQSVSALPSTFSGTNTAAEIATDPKGKFLYVSNRGDNSIAVFSIDPKDGTLSPIEWVPCGGTGPRHFEIDPDGKWLLCANQYSGNVVVFLIDQSTGRLVQTNQSLEINQPVCIRFL